MRLDGIIERLRASSTRSMNSTRNALVSLVVSVLMLLLSFVNRTVFVRCLATEYLGLNGLFSNILNLLALSELGIGNAVSFALYKPLKESDTVKVTSLMHVFGRLYAAVGVTILALGCLLTPFLPFFVGDASQSIPHMRLYFLLYVIGTAVSYLFSYKRTLLVCDQKEYVSTLLTGAFRLLTVALQISALVVTKSYFWYLLAMIVCGLVENIAAAIIADLLYPFLAEHDVVPLDEREQRELRSNTTAILFHKIGGTLVFSSDSILISKFVGLLQMGTYSNYTLIASAIEGILSKTLVSITSSLGNLMAGGEREHAERVFFYMLFANCWIYGFASICLFCLLQPFIVLWIGPDYLQTNAVVLLLVLSFYLTGIRKTVLIFKDASGVFKQDKYKPLVEGIVNIIVSVPLVIRFGVAGVIMGTIFSTLAVAFWFEALVLFRHRFGKGIGGYLCAQLGYLAFNVLVALACVAICRIIPSAGLGSFAARMAVCLVVPNALYVLAFCKTERMAYFVQVFRACEGRIRTRLGTTRQAGGC